MDSRRRTAAWNLAVARELACSQHTIQQIHDLDPDMPLSFLEQLISILESGLITFEALADLAKRDLSLIPDPEGFKILQEAVDAGRHALKECRAILERDGATIQ